MLPKYVYIIGAVVIVILLITIIKSISKKNQRNKEIREAAIARMRDESLNDVILNQRTGKDNKKGSSMPYEVSYQNGGEDPKADKKAFNTSKKGRVEIQLIENTDLSSRKYVFSPYPGITIGSDDDNDIVVINNGVSGKHCEIFAAGKRVYIRNLANDQKTFIRRKKQQAIASAEGLEIKSKDIILVGNVTYTVTIM